MKRTSILSLVLTASLLGAVSSLPSAQPAATGCLPQDGEQTVQAWKDEFQKAMKINAKQEMAQLVRRDNNAAAWWVMETCKQIAIGPSEELEDFIAALQEAWETSMKTKFVRKVYEYYSLMDPRIRKQRRELADGYETARKRYVELVQEKDGPKLELLGREFERFATALDELGDHFFASQAWASYALCYDKDNRGADANYYKACQGYGRCLKHREAIELKDRLYNEIQPIYTRLKGQGYDQDAAEAEKEKEKGGGPGAGVEIAAPAITVPMSFEVVDKVSTYQRPNYSADEIFESWPTLNLTAKGSSTSFGAIEQGPAVLRVGSSDVRIDLDKDGEGDQRVPLTGNITPVELTLGSGDDVRPWAFLSAVGGQQSTYQGLVMNLAPDDHNMTLYVLGAGSMLGDLNGTPIRIIDDNMDGLYGSAPRSWGHVGLNRKGFQQDMDSVVIDKSKRAQPWSEFMQVGDQWYHFEALKGGKEVKATPVEVTGGRLKLKYKGGSPSWLIVKGGGKFENSYFDLAKAGAKGIEVPEGYYKLFYGELRKGKKQQTSKALILPSPETAWEVKAGETTTIELGAPFSFLFDYETADTEVKVLGHSVTVVGAAGERYGRLWNCVARPEASYRKAGSKKGSKPEKMRLLGSQEEITDIEAKQPGMGWPSAWFPLDISLDKKKAEAAVEVQLFEKKNKLFGKIESDWKG